MLVTQYVPSLVDGSDENGNKELAMSEALIAIGVFNDNRLTFAHGVKYNHFHLRRGVALPNMARVLPTNRPTKADLNHMVWETLTHGDVGAVGLPPIPSKP